MATLIQTARTTNLIETNTITPDVFDASVANELVRRYEKITPNSKSNA